MIALALFAIQPAVLFAHKKPQDSDIESIGKRDINNGQTNFTLIANETRIGIRAAAKIERSVHLVDDKFNASAHPGGFIYVNGGTIRASDNEAEQAYVVAQKQPSSSFFTHSPTAKRIKSVEKEIVQVLAARTSNILNTPEFDAIKAQVAAIQSPASR